MNFITFDAAYALYPQATFEDRQALSFAELSQRDTVALGKYATRGWSIAANIWPRAGQTKTLFHPDITRWVRDQHTWMIPLDTDGVTPPPLLSPPSAPFGEDPAVFNSWKLKKEGSSYRIGCNIVHSTIFRHQYLVADKELFENLLAFLKEQGQLEHLKAMSLRAEDFERSWTW
jgi:hypothetical protein